ncbi:MAG: methylated-DNA--[protein]-cysteine S-methyltransferase [Candidatus Riflebacteria bacterium]|nr:methylated-DNA--[protein]-cysteine S-methyltransferase [Candidatus Riflebacteria bacterium]
MKPGFTLFETSLGTCAIAWGEKGICSLRLPEKDTVDLLSKIDSAGSGTKAEIIPQKIKKVICRITAHLAGKLDDLADIELELNGLPEFRKTLYENLRKVPPGKVITYKELAATCGKIGAARATGTALGLNPVPIIIPCHRVLAAGNKLGGFSAYGGTRTKALLLSIEGALPTTCSTEIIDEIQAGIEYLSSKDKTFANIIRCFGPFKLKIDKQQTIFDSLFESIVYQQLTAKAASTISGRVRKALDSDSGSLLSPEKVLEASEESLRACGLSRAKTAALKDLSDKMISGKIPSFEEMNKMSDDEIINVLVQIRGIGRWTAEMLLIFRMGRLDVWPVDDLGIRKGLMILFKLLKLPTPREAQELGKRWKPYRTIPAWYLWRISERGSLEAK